MQAKRIHPVFIPGIGTGCGQVTLQTGLVFLRKIRQLLLEIVALAAFFLGRSAEKGRADLTFS